MKLIGDPAKWRESYARIGLTATVVMLLPAPLLLGDPTGWMLVSLPPLLLPLLFGRWQHRVVALALTLAVVAVCIVSTRQEAKTRERIRRIQAISAAHQPKLTRDDDSEQNTSL